MIVILYMFAIFIFSYHSTNLIFDRFNHNH